jgi:hypothetical protein
VKLTQHQNRPAITAQVKGKVGHSDEIGKLELLWEFKLELNCGNKV